MATGTVNGIPIEALQKTVHDIQEVPEIARYKFRATNRWVAGTHNQATVQNFFGACHEDNSRMRPWVFEADEPPLLLGENTGASPVEYILVALAGCLTTSLVAHAAARGVHVKSVESHLEGDIDVRGFLGLSDQVRNGYQGIRITFHIESDEPDAVIEELVELAQQRSPVFDIVTNPVPVDVSYERAFSD